MNDPSMQIAMRVSWHTLLCNVLLSAFKLLAGIFANSAAMLSDAVHSLSDAASTIVVMIGVKMAGRSSDKEHPYGHERMECVAAIILSAMLITVGLLIGWGGISRIINRETVEAPGVLALVAAVVSIAAKEGMYQYTIAAAKRTGSGALKADAWHHRSDALSSVGSFAGILGARLGFPVLDAVACLVICVFILKVGADIFLDAAGKMTDRACDDKTDDEIRSVILENKAVLGIDRLSTRLFGNKIYIELEISSDGQATLDEAHRVAEDVHDAIEAMFPQVKHCTVHMNPARCSVESNPVSE